MSVTNAFLLSTAHCVTTPLLLAQTLARQVLEEVDVGPIPVGVNKFVLTAGKLFINGNGLKRLGVRNRSETRDLFSTPEECVPFVCSSRIFNQWLVDPGCYKRNFLLVRTVLPGALNFVF